MKDAIKPVIIIATIKPTIHRVQDTNAQVYDQGITYNEAGLTYNEIGYAYGGLYEHSIVPLVSLATAVKPSIVRAYDIGSSLPASNAGVPYRLLLALTYDA